MPNHQQLIAWVQDAHAMEVEIIKVLEHHHDDAEQFPEVQEKIQEHIAVTKIQADRLKQLLIDLEEDTSSARSFIAQMMGALTGPVTGLFNDKIIKNSLLEYATEHFEIASYTSLLAAAEELGESEIVSVVQQNLQEEKEMAAWLEQQLPNLTRQFLKQDAE